MIAEENEQEEDQDKKNPEFIPDGERIPTDENELFDIDKFLPKDPEEDEKEVRKKNIKESISK